MLMIQMSINSFWGVLAADTLVFAVFSMMPLDLCSVPYLPFTLLQSCSSYL